MVDSSSPTSSGMVDYVPQACHKADRASQCATTGGKTSAPVANASASAPTGGRTVTWVSTIASICCGVVFGFVLHKAGVYKASVIMGQFRFTNFRMLKVRRVL